MYGVIRKSFPLVSDKRVCLTLQDVLLGKLEAEVNLLHFFITPFKLHIWIGRNHGVTPDLRLRSH